MNGKKKNRFSLPFKFPVKGVITLAIGMNGVMVQLMSCVKVKFPFGEALIKDINSLQLDI